MIRDSSTLCDNIVIFFQKNWELSHNMFTFVKVYVFSYAVQPILYFIKQSAFHQKKSDFALEISFQSYICHKFKVNLLLGTVAKFSKGIQNEF